MMAGNANEGMAVDNSTHTGVGESTGENSTVRMPVGVNACASTETDADTSMSESSTAHVSASASMGTGASTSQLTAAQQACDTPLQTERPARTEDELTIHYPCKYVPVEMLAGFGAGCWPVTYEAEGFERADELAHPNLCGFAKSLLAYAARPDVHAIVLTTCCDAMRRVYDVLAREGSVEFLYLLDLPHLRGPREVERYKRELRRLARAWAEWSGQEFSLAQALRSFDVPVPRTDERVSLVGAHAPLSLVNTCRDQLHLHVENATCTGFRQVPSPPPTLMRAPSSGCHACEVGEPANNGPVEANDAEKTAENGTAAMEPARADGAAPSTYLEQTAATAACADGVNNSQATTAAPSAPSPADDLERFLDWYAGALLNQLPCMRMAEAGERKGLVSATGQHGVIYHTMKFCDYYGFEYLEAARTSEVPMLKIETDGTKQSAGQLKTRLAAFDETLAGLAETGKAGRVKAGGPVYVLGVDSGSTSTDAVIVDGEGQVAASVIVPTGAKASAGAERAITEVLAQAGLAEGDLTLRVSTGYGRDAIAGMDCAITEITCHARGAHALAPEARTVIDIGGQDSKVIHLDERGGVLNFVMNDKCAAGTGRFLEATARALELELPEFCRVGLEWKHEVKISSMCTVFAESEVVSLVADDTPVADIVHGLDMSVAGKTAALAKRVGAEPAYLMTGGVAQNVGVVRALEQVLGNPVATHKDSQLCGAIGAALLGLESLG